MVLHPPVRLSDFSSVRKSEVQKNAVQGGDATTMCLLYLLKDTVWALLCVTVCLLIWFFYWLLDLSEFQWRTATEMQPSITGNDAARSWELEGEMRQGICSKWCLTATLKGLCVRTLFVFNMHMHVCGYKQNCWKRGLNSPQGAKILGPHDPSSGWGPAVLSEACAG